jgi:hypothetical protein
MSQLDRWLLATLAGAGTLLLVVYLVAGCLRQPIRRLRWSEWGLVAALTLSVASLAPAWLIVTLPATPTPQPAALVAPLPEPEIPPGEFVLIGPGVELPLEEAPAPVALEQPVPVAAPASAPIDWAGLGMRALWLAYLTGAGFFLVRWLLGVIGLARLIHSSVPAPEWVRAQAAERLAGVRVLCSPRVEVPFSCGLFRPTIVLPAGLIEQVPADQLSWLLAHETAHLRRGDPRVCWLFTLLAVLFYPFPWFWSLRGRLRLDQEYLADAEAVEVGSRVEYAEFLLQWTTRAASRRVPAAGVGVLGRSSDLFRRISMLLRGQPSVETRSPRLWSLVVGPALLAVAILAAGVGFDASAAPVPEGKQPEPKKEEPKKEEPKKEEPRKNVVPDFPPFPDLEKLIPPNANLDPEQLKRLQEEMKRVQEDIRKAQEEFQKEMQKQFPGGLPGRPGAGLPGLPGIGGLPGQGGLPGIGGLPGGLINPNVLDRLRAGRGEGRLGVKVARPSETLVEQLDLPRNQGLVLERVEEGSAAAKAGLKAHDILLELAGKPVSSNQAELIQQIQGIKADQAVDAVVLRKGKKETVKNLTLPEPKAVPVQPGLPGINFPNVFPNLPNVPGGGNVNLTINRNGNSFTTQFSEGDVEMTLQGTANGGVGTLDEVAITVDGKTTKYDSVDKVPEAYRARVREVLEWSATGRTRLIR